MNFEECYNLLASRPKHSHEHAPCDASDATAERQTCDHQQQQQVQQQQQQQVQHQQQQQEPESSDAANESAKNEDVPVDAVVDERDAATLVRAFLALQERRVDIYRRFETGFKQHQATAGFQAFCTDITCEFADVSAQINAIESTLRTRQLTALAGLLRRVQEQEKEKLVLTSALLVEKMRLADQQRCAEPDDSVSVLLERSIVSLSKQQQAIVERINEFLDEIRMELLELSSIDDQE
ncbi:hypothetical protein PINS_up003044 [Pythium insidiosum]|nr:hypothetical protein PINS_up003044 [Pythium insidiosum]